MNDSLTIICGQCDSPAKFHSASYRQITVGVCDRGEDFIHPDRGDFTSQSGEFRRKTVSDYYVDVPFMKLAKAYFSGWGHNREGMLDLIVNAYIVDDPTGPAARLIRGGLIMDGVAEDRDIIGNTGHTVVGASDYDDPNHLPFLKELDKLDRWQDGTHFVDRDFNQSWVGTSVLGDEHQGEYRFAQYQQNDGKLFRSMTPVENDHNQFISHSAYVEGFDGYSTVQVLDEELTLKHHERILNVYRKNGNLRCGSVEIIRDTEADVVTARCVRGNCQSAPLQVNIAKEAAYAEAYEMDVAEHLRNVMVQFTMDVIRHGNNHAASWFTSRPSWYKVHHPRCTLNDCSDALHYCPDLLPEVPDSPSLTLADLVSEKDLTDLAEFVNLQRSA